MTNPNKGKWYRFNDTIVEEFEMTDATLEAECFGGKYKAKVYDSCKLHHVQVNSLRHFFGFCCTYVCISLCAGMFEWVDGFLVGG